MEKMGMYLFSATGLSLGVNRMQLRKTDFIYYWGDILFRPRARGPPTAPSLRVRRMRRGILPFYDIQHVNKVGSGVGAYIGDIL